MAGTEHPTPILIPVSLALSDDGPSVAASLYKLCFGWTQLSASEV